jgi:hypothetical protein
MGDRKAIWERAVDVNNTKVYVTNNEFLMDVTLIFYRT